MLITLLTDFGTRDYFVGAMKGAILSINRQAEIIDITHEIPPQDIRAAAFTLLNYYKTFPKNTIHLCVVDPGVGSERRAILVKTKDYYFVAPDNGLLSYIFEREADLRVFELTNNKFFAENISQTFHGRDVFAPIAAHLSKGINTEEFGMEITNFIRFESSKPQKISETETAAAIIHVDNFGNLVTNLKSAYLPARFMLEINGKEIKKIRKFYAEAESEELFMIFGSAEFLEIAAFQNSATDLLKVKNGDPVLLKKLLSD